MPGANRSSDRLPMGRRGRAGRASQKARARRGQRQARIARALGVREETIQRLVRGDARTISPEPVTR